MFAVDIGCQWAFQFNEYFALEQPTQAEIAKNREIAKALQAKKANAVVLRMQRHWRRSLDRHSF